MNNPPRSINDSTSAIAVANALESNLLRSVLIAVCFAFCLLSFNANAQTLNIPATNTTGTFTVSYSVGMGGGMVYELQNGNWVQVGGGSSSGSFDLTRPNGTYNYQLKQCYSGPCNLVASKSITVTIASNPSPTTLATPATISLPTTEVDGQFTVQWSSVAGASYYVLEQMKSGGSYSETYRGTELAYGALVDPGSYKFRVKACKPQDVDCSAFKESSFVTVTGSSASLNRRVIYLHTDSLGSPAAETNENGLENE